jgi:heme-degrading monooxygenase HmoA
MIALIFEARPHADRTQAYLDAAERLRPLLTDIVGFVSIERFESLAEPGKILSISSGVTRMRYISGAMSRSIAASRAGRQSIFADYRLRVA